VVSKTFTLGCTNAGGSVTKNQAVNYSVPTETDKPFNQDQSYADGSVDYPNLPLADMVQCPNDFLAAIQTALTGVQYENVIIVKIVTDGASGSRVVYRVTCATSDLSAVTAKITAVFVAGNGAFTCSSPPSRRQRRAFGAQTGNASTVTNATGEDLCANVVCQNQTCYSANTCNNGVCVPTLKAEGATCDDTDATTENDKCTIDGQCYGTKIAVNCVVTAWTAWGTCSSGSVFQKTHTRTVTTQPVFSGAPCPTLTETTVCPPVDCQLGLNFGPTQQCVDGTTPKQSDGQYYETRAYEILGQPKYGGAACPTDQILTQCINVDCELTAYAKDGTCDCTTGKKMETRSVQVGAQFAGMPCDATRSREMQCGAEELATDCPSSGKSLTAGVIVVIVLACCLAVCLIIYIVVRSRRAQKKDIRTPALAAKASEHINAAYMVDPGTFDSAEGLNPEDTVTVHRTMTSSFV
jgi:hypothetical protein